MQRVRAILPIPTPFLRRRRTVANRFGSSFRRRPRTLPWALARPRPERTRSRMIARSNSANTPIIWNSAFPAGVAPVPVEDHASYTDIVRRPILLEIRNRVLSLDERLRQTERCTSKQRIAYKVPGGKIFLEVKIQRAAIVLHLADGGCPDPSGVTDNIPTTHGWRQLKKRITIKHIADLEAATPFIISAYRARP